ncbi:MAG: hypothetical protein JJT94_14710, partial [Bernardetiaceae bacterium]|nr:hypothetical protein [Bernardetiaceae bacterium]
EYRFLFNAGSERISQLDLHWHDTPFRSYDPQLGRFWGVDALADYFASITSYQYAYNNPIGFNDPTGLAAEEPGAPITIAGEDNNPSGEGEGGASTMSQGKKADDPASKASPDPDWYMNADGHVMWFPVSTNVKNYEGEEYHNIGESYVMERNNHLFLYHQNILIHTVSLDAAEEEDKLELWEIGIADFTSPTEPYGLYETLRDRKQFLGRVNSPLAYFGITTAQPPINRYPRGSIERRFFTLITMAYNGNIGNYNSKTIARGAEQALINLNSPVLHVSLSNRIDNLRNSTSPLRVQVYLTRLTVGSRFLFKTNPFWMIRYKK